MSTTEPQDGEVFESSRSEVGTADDGTDSGALIMADVADPSLEDELSEREDGIGERKEMGPEIDWEAEAPDDEAAFDDMAEADQEVTPIPLDEGN